MAAIAGMYWNRVNDNFAKILARDGKLQVELGGGEVHVLKPSEEARFNIADVPWGNDVDIHFVAATGVKPRLLEVSFGGGKPDTFEAVTPFDSTVPELAEYTGAYMSEEIDPVYRIAPQDGNLSLTRLNTGPVLLGRPCGMFLLEILVRYSSRPTRTRIFLVLFSILAAFRISGSRGKRISIPENDPLSKGLQLFLSLEGRATGECERHIVALFVFEMP
jgi:hypothetical protein